MASVCTLCLRSLGRGKKTLGAAAEAPGAGRCLEPRGLRRADRTGGTRPAAAGWSQHNFGGGGGRSRVGTSQSSLGNAEVSPAVGVGPLESGVSWRPSPPPPCVPAPRALQATRDGPGSAPLPSRTPGSQGALGHEGRSWATGMSTMTRWVRGAPRGLLLCTPRWPWRCLRAEGGLPPGGLGRRGGGGLLSEAPSARG